MVLTYNELRIGKYYYVRAKGDFRSPGNENGPLQFVELNNYSGGPGGKFEGVGEYNIHMPSWSYFLAKDDNGSTLPQPVNPAELLLDPQPVARQTRKRKSRRSKSQRKKRTRKNM
jgi:hypothetical protein